MSDGKYITLDLLKAYGLNNDVTTTPDDPFLSQAILRAEQRWDSETGVQWNAQTFTLVQAFNPYIDKNGWLHVQAREAMPVNSVTQMRMMFYNNPSAGWKDVDLSGDNLILPLSMVPPNVDDKMVSVYVPGLFSIQTGELRVQWSYNAGYQPIPDALKTIICRIAWVYYKYREVPVASVTAGAAGIGIVQMPIDLPPDLRREIQLWRPQWI